MPHSSATEYRIGVSGFPQPTVVRQGSADALVNTNFLRVSSEEHRMRMEPPCCCCLLAATSATRGGSPFTYGSQSHAIA